MSFNWPDIPFSGTEVDAFVVAYKEFAQEILDAFPKEFYSESTDVGHLLLPYGTKQNLKVYLENALLYSAFVVKQRAGNSGPGTDFELGNSPLNVPLNGPQSQTLLGRLGCTLDNDKMDICYESGDPDNPDDNKVEPNNPPPEIQDVARGAMGSPFPNPNGNTNPNGNPPEPQPCPPAVNNYQGGGEKAINQGNTVDRSLLWKLYANAVKAWGLLQAVIGRGSVYTAGDMLSHYLTGSGSTYTSAGPVNGVLGVEIRSYINEDTVTRTELLNPSATQRSAYGMSATDNLYSVSFYGYMWLAAIFGTALVITDGSEELVDLGNIGQVPVEINYVKAVVDDYDFNYAWSIVRSASFPGKPVDFDNGDQVESGQYLCPDNGPQNTVCQALTQNGKTNFHGTQYIIRLPVTEAHGDGCQTFDPNDPSKGAPFPVFISFSRTSGNGL